MGACAWDFAHASPRNCGSPHTLVMVPRLAPFVAPLSSASLGVQGGAICVSIFSVYVVCVAFNMLQHIFPCGTCADQYVAAPTDTFFGAPIAVQGVDTVITGSDICC